VYLERYKRGQLREVQRFIAQLTEDVTGLLGARLDPVQMKSVRNARLQSLLADLGRLSDASATAMTNYTQSQLRDLAAYESGFLVASARSVLPAVVSFDAVAPVQLWAAVTARPFEGRLLEDWVADYTVAQRKKLEQAVRTSVVEGETIDQAIRRIRGTAKLNGSDGVLPGATRKTAEALTRTAINHVTTTARERTYQDNQQVVKGVQWRSTLDGRTSLVCISRDGTVYELDAGPRPPAHPNCFPGDQMVTALPPLQAATQRVYDGEMITLRMASGQELTLTPNHPVLTARGWQAAGLLDQSDHLVRHGRGERMAAAQLPHDHVPTPIEQVVETLRQNEQMLAAEVPVTAKDFHGDAADGQVAVVWADRGLLPRSQASLLEQLFDLNFQSRNAELALLSSLSTSAEAFDRVDLTPSLFVGFSGQSSSLIGRSSAHSGQHLFRTSTEAAALLNDALLDQTIRQVQGLSDPSGTHPFIEELDHVVEVRRCRKDGGWQVYNLQTEGSFYGINGYTVHNCRSTTVPVLKSWKELGLDLAEADEGTRASMNGQVPASETYQTWLKRQPTGFQDDVLGVQRASLFRQGKLTVDKFVDESGKVYTMEQLRAKHPAAF
jgi:SPP1 gp7 family putative phage head morphogenesis protein